MRDDRIRRQVLSTMATTAELLDRLAEQQRVLAEHMERAARNVAELNELLSRAKIR